MSTNRLIDRAKQWARSIKRDVVGLWIAARDPRVPWYAKAAAAAVAAYALSPIDFIPDLRRRSRHEHRSRPAGH